MNGTIRIFASYSGAAAVRSLRSRGWAQAAVIAGFAAVAGGLMIGTYVSFLRAFRFMLADAIAGPVIAHFSVQAAFAAVLFLGVASFALTSPVSLFRFGPSQIVDAAPIGSVWRFASRFATAAVLSLWPLAFIGAPMLAALATVRGATVAYAALAAVDLIAFGFGIAALGALASFLLAPLFAVLRGRFGGLIAVIAVCGIGWAIIRMALPPLSFFLVSTPNQALTAIEALNHRFSILPSSPFAAVITAALPYGASFTGVRNGLLVAIAAEAAVFIALLLIAWRRFDATLAKFRERSSRVPHAAVGNRGRFPRLFTWRHGFLFEKTALEFVRNSADISQFAFIILMLAAYVATLRYLPGYAATPDATARLATAAYVAIGFFSIMAGLRFAFPAMPRERQRGWVALSSPLHGHEVFSWHLFFWGLVVATLSAAAAAMTVWFLRLTPAAAMFFLVASVVSAITVVTICLAQGAAFGGPQVNDPEVLSTSPAGLAALVLCGGYLWVSAGYVFRFVAASASAGRASTISAFGDVVVSAAMIGVFWYFGTHAAEQRGVG